jgi:hypothetical protein
MTESNATILIPDISGFTEFMTRTELSHGSYAINVLIDAIINAVGEEYDVSEIEGDAVLLIRKGPSPSRKEIQDICLKIFSEFHFRRKWMQRFAVCPCGACLAISKLTLKFVVHHGPLAEIKVGRFVKQSGPEMIVAHRLLKNSIDNHEYLLMSDKVLQQTTDPFEEIELAWTQSSDEYAAIGKVGYQIALLSNARNNVPEPPELPTYYSDNTPFLEIPIASSFRDVYMVVMDIPGRPVWMPSLQKVEQDDPIVYVGSIHKCTFENCQMVVSPLRMKLNGDSILYAESWRNEELHLSLVYEFIFRKVDDFNCLFSARCMREDSTAAEKNDGPLPSVEQIAEKLRIYCEQASVIAQVRIGRSVF